nr:MAG TPA: hypothetical protein [Caudoviricetes sp.]
MGSGARLPTHKQDKQGRIALAQIFYLSKGYSYLREMVTNPTSV